MSIPASGKQPTRKSAEYITVAIMIFLSVSGAACNDNELINYYADCPAKDTTHVTPVRLDEVVIFLDGTGSMKPFMPKSSRTTDFGYLLPDFINRLKRELPAVTLLAIGLKNKVIDTFETDDILYGNLSFGGFSTIPDMLDSAVSRAEQECVSIFITDAIYSPKESNIKDRSQIISQVSAVASKAYKKGLTLSCFQLFSRYKGGLMKPWYLFVTGTRQNVYHIEQKLKRSLAIQQKNISNEFINQVRLQQTEVKPFYSIIPYADNSGAGIPVACPEADNRYLIINNADLQGSPEIWVGLDLAEYPDYTEDMAYLDHNLSISGTNLSAKLVDSIMNASQFMTRVNDPVDRDLARKCTHFIRIRLGDLTSRKGIITISLKRRQPDWVHRFSHNVGDSAEKIHDRTFGLENIITGLEDAYQSDNAGFFFQDLKITVNRK